MLPDYMSRGQQLLSYLERRGFHIAIYGHRHLAGYRLNFGLETDQSDSAMHELVGVINGRFDTKDSLREAFHVVEVLPGELGQRIVRITRLQRSGLDVVAGTATNVLVVDESGTSRRLGFSGS